jgi:hypothetical protein
MFNSEQNRAFGLRSIPGLREAAQAPEKQWDFSLKIRHLAVAAGAATGRRCA